MRSPSPPSDSLWPLFAQSFLITLLILGGACLLVGGLQWVLVQAIAVGEME